MAARHIVIVAFTLSIAFVVNCTDDPKSPLPPPNYHKAHHCCEEPNILERPCRTKTLFNCSNGAYILDPWLEPLDEFVIGDDGSLESLTGEEFGARDSYCVSRYEPLANESRYVAKVCFPDVASASYKNALFTVKGSLALFSVIFLIITLYVYNVIVMRDTQDRVVRIALYCLLAFFLLLGSTQLFTDALMATNTCTVVAFLIHFFVISYFAWINMVMANVWKSVVVPRWAIQEHKWYRWNHIYAWSIPVALEMLILFGHVTSHEVLDPRIGVHSCWFATNAISMWYLYLPITIMILINVVLFIWTCIVLHKFGSEFNPEKRNALKYRVMMYLKFFLLVGLTWIFEVMSFVSEEHVIWLFFDIINALHGFLLFLILVVFRSRVKRELAGKKICCCLHAPHHWRDKEDVEHQRLNENDDEGTMGIGINANVDS